MLYKQEVVVLKYLLFQVNGFVQHGVYARKGEHVLRYHTFVILEGSDLNHVVALE